MEILYERCAGLDVHKNVVVACVRIGSGSSGRHEHRRFATTTAGLLELKEWLASLDCGHAVMEATGVYWKPVWHVLEDGVELVLANAHHVKNVPGRKSDMNDATWLADLLAHGLVRGSSPANSACTMARSSGHCVTRRRSGARPWPARSTPSSRTSSSVSSICPS